MVSVVCPFCGKLIPVTGTGSKMTVKIKGPGKPLPDPTAPPRPSLKNFLAEHAGGYWDLVRVFVGEHDEFLIKNPNPLVAAAEYMRHINQGISPALILEYAKRMRERTDAQYMPQLAKWLANQDFTAIAPKSEDRWAGRNHVD